MSSDGLLLKRTFPGATTCVLVGGLPAAARPDFRAYRSLLWLVRQAAAIHPPVHTAFPAITAIHPESASAEEIKIAIQRFVGLNARCLPSVYATTEIAGAAGAVYQPLLSELYDFLESQHRARVTRQRDGFVWQKHLLGNLSAYARQRLPSAWAGGLRGLPAFVCGAGPSLDVSAPRLAALAGCGAIFAADSALRTLARHGVTADFAVSIDAAKTPPRCLPDRFCPSRVVLSAVSPPEWISAVPAERSVFLSSNQITLDWLGEFGIGRTDLEVTESCGSTGLALARYLGCRPIYLFGLDLAVDAQNQTQRHAAEADPALYAHSGFNPVQTFPSVPGNYALQVPCPFYGDWQALDARLATWPADLVFNVNDRGARLRNTTLVPPDQFTLSENLGDKPARLAALPQPVFDPASLAKALDALHATAAEGARWQTDLPTALQHSGVEALARKLRPLFANRSFSRTMGAFALKVMPNLIPPIPPEPDFWKSMLNELEILTALAQNDHAFAGSGREAYTTA